MLRHSFTYKFRTAQNLFIAFVAGTLFAKPTMHTDTVADATKFAGVLFFAVVQMLFDGQLPFLLPPHTLLVTTLQVLTLALIQSW